MLDVPVNWLAVAACVVSNFVIGGFWYSPVLFLKPWLAMSGVDKERFNAGLPKALVGDFFSALAMASVLALIISPAGMDLHGALLVGFLIWLGFVATSLLHSFTYEQRPVGFYAINAGYRLVTLLVMSAILSLWH